MNRLSINWDYVAASVCTPLHETRETGINEVTRLLHGECITIDHGKVSRVCYWNPFEVVREEPLEDVDQAVSTLRHTTRSCVHAWASRYPSILELLSGGLDSSIVASCLADSPSRPIVTCVNYRNKYDPSTDERSFAALAAERAGFPILEQEWPSQLDLSGILEVPIHACPFNNVFQFATAEMLRQTARDCGATGYFTGEGGD
jgi:asparagine synthase (glutamine-hydrolysing)